MEDDIELTLAPPIPPGLLAALDRIPGLRVQSGDTRSYLRHGPAELPLQILPRSAIDNRQHLEALARTDFDQEPGGPLPLVVATSLPRLLRHELAEQRISYA